LKPIFDKLCHEQGIEKGSEPKAKEFVMGFFYGFIYKDFILREAFITYKWKVLKMGLKSREVNCLKKIDLAYDKF
jgi:hypothetical protein